MGTWGYFTAFRPASGASTYYGDNRTAARLDLVTGALWALYGTSYLLVLVLVVGSRERRAISAVRYLAHLYTCHVVLVGKSDVYWRVAPTGPHLDLRRCLYTLSPAHTATGRLAIHLGLNHANITYTGHVDNDNASASESFHYNEEMPWFAHPLQPRDTYRAARARGLPHVLQTAMENFAIQASDNGWVPSLRTIGYCCWGLLWLAFALWAVSTFFLLSHHISLYCVTFYIIAITLLLVCILYSSLVPANIRLYFCGTFTDTKLGFNFYFCVSGILVAFFQAILMSGKLYNNFCKRSDGDSDVKNTPPIKDLTYQRRSLPQNVDHQMTSALRQKYNSNDK